MSTLNREEFFARLHERVGNDSTDEGIKFLEDMTDTYNELEKKVDFYFNTPVIDVKKTDDGYTVLTKDKE